MSPQLATVGLSVVPPVAALAIIYGRFVRNITVKVQVFIFKGIENFFLNKKY